MLCRKPFVQGMHAYGCGQCIPCRISRRRVWAHRMMLEALEHKDNCFVTLTYSDENLPMKGCMSTLKPLDVQNWLKRLRTWYQRTGVLLRLNAPLRLRFFLVGEYGDHTERPHYHVALFGYPGCRYVHSRYDARRVNCCVWCDGIRDTWGLGHIFVGALENESAHYIAGYVVKKMTSVTDVRLLGRHPEFARMSLRPGIGAGLMDDVASTLLFHELEQRLLDVPSSLRHGEKELPLGRYLRRRLRERVGKEVSEPGEVSLERSKEMHGVYMANIDDPSKSVTERLVEAMEGKIASVEARLKIHKKRSSL